jgi:hypothetical protein
VRRRNMLRYSTENGIHGPSRRCNGTFLSLARHGSDVCIHSALRWRDCIARRALMGLALLNLITFAALGVAEPFSRV